MTDRDVHDLLVVGGGPAGVGIAYHLREDNLDVKVLEAGEEVGGRTKSVSMPGGMANPGAQFVYRSTPSEELVIELGLETIAFEPTTYGIAVGGTTSVAATNADVVEGLPLQPDERAALLAVLDEAVEEYQGSTRHGVFLDRAAALGDESLAERLRQLPPRVAEIIRTSVRGGSVGEPEKLLARYALRYFASYAAHETENRLVVAGGQQAITLGMAGALPRDTIELGTRVSAVERDPERDGYVVTAAGPGGADTYRAHRVAVTVPAPLVTRLVPDLPVDKLRAIAKAETPGSTTMVVAADLTGVEEYRDWAFVTTVGRRFDCIINPTPGRWRTPHEPGVVHFACYGNAQGYQPGIADDLDEQRAWLEDFLGVAPGLRGRVLAHHLATWEHCFALLSPARAGVVPLLQQPVGRIHFAGDWTSPSAGTHGALGEAARVAQEVRAARSA